MGDASFAADERATWRLRLPFVREAVLCTGLAAVTASLLVWLGPPGGDLAAHEYQRRLFLPHGFTLWDNFWYAGRYAFVGYSILYYPLAALLGIRLLAVLTVALAAGAFARLLEREWGSAARWAGRCFALVWPGVILAAEFPLALGVALALLCLLALQAGRRWTRRGADHPRRSRRAPSRSSCSPSCSPGSQSGAARPSAARRCRAGARASRVAAAAELVTLHLFPSALSRFPACEAVQAVVFCVVLLALTWRLERARGLRGCPRRLSASPSSRSMRSRRGSGMTSRACASSPSRSRCSSRRCGAGGRCRSCSWPSGSRQPGTSSRWPSGWASSTADRSANAAVWPRSGRLSARAPAPRATAWRPWTRSSTGRRSILARGGHPARARLVPAGRPSRRPRSSTAGSPRRSTSRWLRSARRRSTSS